MLEELASLSPEAGGRSTGPADPVGRQTGRLLLERASAGFGHLPSEAEADDLARAAGRTVAWEWSAVPTYPRVTFLPH